MTKTRVKPVCATQTTGRAKAPRKRARKTYILSHEGFGDSPQEVERRIQDADGLAIVDRFADSLVVEGDHQDITTLLKGLHGWSSAPERRVAQPHPRAAP